MKWSGAIGLEMEWRLVEGHTQITNLVNKDDDFHNETEIKQWS